MSAISNDAEFKAALESQPAAAQRELAAKFVGNVLSLSNDDRIARVVKVAADNQVSEDELLAAFKSAKAAVMDCYTRCGADADWAAQAGYFVARAAAAAVTPEEQGKAGGAAWQAAMSSRMARTAQLIESGDSSTSLESEQQYRMLTEFLNKGAAS
jgi:hypothetical protein